MKAARAIPTYEADPEVEALLVELSRTPADQLEARAARTAGARDQATFLSDVFRACVGPRIFDDLEAVLAAHGSAGLGAYAEGLRSACELMVHRRLDAAVEAVVELAHAEISNPLIGVLIGWAQVAGSKLAEAFHNLWRASQVIEAHEHIRLSALRCLVSVEAVRYNDELAAGALAYLREPRLNVDRVAPLACSLLRASHRLGEPRPLADLETLAEDRLLIESIAQIHLRDPELELFLTEIRGRLLRQAATGQPLPPSLTELLCALVLQADVNEHVFFVSEEEQGILTNYVRHLEQLLDADAEPAALVGTLLFVALYEPLHELPYHRKLLAIPAAAWPEAVQGVLARILHHREEEKTMAASIARLTPIEDQVSSRVRAQYEENPYPRWTRADAVPARRAYLDEVRATTGIRKLPEVEARPRVLVAGCGTGKHPIELALAHPELDITAVDLSRASLAYARIQAERLGVGNIRFLQADILQLDALEDRFPIIECLGVLHHMADPSEGLAVLRRLLRKDGIIKLGLYSRHARREIIELRSKRPAASARSDIRALRRAIISNPRRPGRIVRSRDFYGTSACRDLLLHEQEHQFDVPGLARLLKRNRLVFRGFQFENGQVEVAFRRARPKANPRKLRPWNAFEQKRPTTFGAMYQFFAQASAG